MPVLLRIRNLAVLPNRVKANLKGCFVIAHGHGDLASERAYLRLVTLSCITKEGYSVIDQPVKGYISDSDGKIGLAGRVVSKMGTAIARAMFAGFFKGVGDVIESDATITNITALGGTTRTLEGGRIGQAGVGKGLQSGAREIQKFYMELARQTMPVIEIGATRDVTLVVTQGVELKIRCIGGKRCEENY
jgi:conjugal transfer pilus assembly protein TraB